MAERRMAGPIELAPEDIHSEHSSEEAEHKEPDDDDEVSPSERRDELRPLNTLRFSKTRFSAAAVNVDIEQSSPASDPVQDPAQDVVPDDAIMADGPWQWRPPRLRKDWDDLPKHKKGNGELTREETIWMVVICLSFSKCRAEIAEKHDVRGYVLHFFVSWSVLYSAILYSSRFNDRDYWHRVMWMLIYLVLFFATDSLYVYSVPYGIANCVLHCLIGIMNARVAIFLPRARVYCTWMAFQSSANAALFAFLACSTPHSTAFDTLLVINMFLQPAMYTCYKLVLWFLNYLYSKDGEDSVAYGDSCHVPADFAYQLNRWKGTHILMIVSTILSPIAMHGGQAFYTSNVAKLIVVLAFIFAFALKMSILDIDVIKGQGPESFRHPLRRGMFHSRLFLLLFPISVCGLALTGMSFFVTILCSASLTYTGEYSAAAGQYVIFTQAGLSFAPAVLWSVLTINRAMTLPKPECETVHYLKICALCFYVLVFLVPYCFGFGRVATVVWAVSVQVSILGTLVYATKFEGEIQMASSYGKKASDYGSWEIGEVKLVMDWEPADRELMQTGSLPHVPDKSIGSNIDVHETFSSVTFGAAMIANIEFLTSSPTGSGLALFALHFSTTYATLAMLMRYSSRFAAKDLSHRLAWTGYQFLLIMMVVGMSTKNFWVFSLFSVCAFLYIAFAFWLRIVIYLPRGRAYAVWCFVECFLLAGACSIRFFDDSLTSIVLNLVLVICLSGLCEPLFRWGCDLFVADYESKLQTVLPMNVEYIQKRFTSLYASLISTALAFAGAANTPWHTAHTTLVCVGVVCVGFVAISFQSALFHVEPISIRRHALRTSKVLGLLFLALEPCTLFCMATTGAAMSIMLSPVGSDGWQASTPFAQHLFCIACSCFWFCVAVVNNTHALRPFPHSRAARNLKTATTLACMVLCLVPLLYSCFYNSMGNLAILVYAAVFNSCARWAHLRINGWADGERNKLMLIKNSRNSFVWRSQVSQAMI